MHHSLIELKIKTIQPIFRLLVFLSQDFSDLNFDTLPFVFSFNLAELYNC